MAILLPTPGRGETEQACSAARDKFSASGSNGAATTAAEASDPAFKKLLESHIPHLRAYGRSLCGDLDHADDLVQETMVRCWQSRARFAPGTNFRAWSFTILRNLFLSQARRRKFSGNWDENVAERLLVVSASQDMTIELADMLRALRQLPASQREALMLVGAAGLSYEDVAQIMGVAMGTVKSRVSRARLALLAALEGGQLETSRRETERDGDLVAVIMADVENIRDRPRSSMTAQFAA
jgi:RNA polymerase sigma factor (sigma-70 family)